MNNRLSSLPVPKPDPIFAASKLARASGTDAIDATIGVCMDEEGSPLLLDSTQRAEQLRVSELRPRDFSYPPILGREDYRQSVHALLLASDQERLASFATAGGQGALHTNLQLLKRLVSKPVMILPTPAWGNHFDLCKGAEVELRSAEYIPDGTPTLEHIHNALQKTHGQAAVLLQVGGQNPTGLDFTRQQWGELAGLLEKYNAIAFLDFAYQGFVSEPEGDAFPVELFSQKNVETFIAWSASKNHSIYSYRTGLAAAIAPDESTRHIIEGHYSDLSSELQSAAPTPGQALVAIVQQRLQVEWRSELRNIRSLLTEKRRLLKELLGMDRFVTALEGNGLFARLPINPQEIERLRHEQKVFLLDDGRVNIAGVPLTRIPELAEKIRRVIPA